MYSILNGLLGFVLLTKNVNMFILVNMFSVTSQPKCFDLDVYFRYCFIGMVVCNHVVIDCNTVYQLCVPYLCVICLLSILGNS